MQYRVSVALDGTLTHLWGESLLGSALGYGHGLLAWSV